MSKAASGGDAAAVKALVADGADVNARDNGYTPLMFAARAGNVEAIKALIDAKADLNLRDCAADDGWTPLIHAIHKRQNAAARALVERGADVNAREGGCEEQLAEGGRTPLMYAASYDNAEMVKFLLERGADPLADSRGENALTYAVSGAAYGKLADLDRTAAPCPVETVKALLAKAPDLIESEGTRDRATTYVLKKKCPELAGLLEGQRVTPTNTTAPPRASAQN